MRISDLKREIDARFAQVDEHFAQIDARFARIDDRFAQIDARFARVDERFAQIDARFAQVDVRFALVDARFDRIEARLAELDTKIDTQAEATRRHFDMVAENMNTRFQVVLDQLMAMNARAAERDALNRAEHEGFQRWMENHEFRIKTVESRH